MEVSDMEKIKKVGGPEIDTVGLLYYIFVNKETHNTNVTFEQKPEGSGNESMDMCEKYN